MEKLLVAGECSAEQIFLVKPRGWNACTRSLDQNGNYLLELGNFLNRPSVPPRAQGARLPQETLNE
jgi:hypothetical protein